MARIPEETLQQVLAATDIVDLIGRSVKLRRAGVNWVGLCPFHNEKTPSFNVRPSTNSYHCFGCGAGGNAFRFVMEHDGLTFMEAVKRLAEAAGIRIQEEVWDANAEKAARLRAQLVRVHKELAEWYHQLLLRHEMAGVARSYLKGRGITSAMAKNWQIGYAPAAASFLRQWAAQHQFGQELLVEAGILALSQERGDVYPRFRDRLMFPIRNENGEVIAFSGRLLDPEAKSAKYLNSPETPIFNKSKVLFGFDKARRAIAKAGQAIVCEGQIDTLMLYEAGFQNVVAGQGTAFTEFHARKLKGTADEVVLCYDSDNAGFKAAERAFQILAPAGLIVKVAALPAGEDPDSMIRKHGVETFQKLLGSAQDFMDYQMEAAGKRRNLEEMRERIRFAEEMVANIRLLESPVAQQTAAQRIALRLGVPDDIVRKMLARKPQGQARNKAPEEKVEKTGQQLLDDEDKNALLLCRMALADPEVLLWLRQSGREHVLHDLPGTRLLALVWQATYDPADAGAVNVYLSTLEREEEAAIIHLLHQPTPAQGVEAADHALRAMELNRLQLLRQRLQTQLKHPAIDPAEAEDIQREIMELHKEIQETQKELLRLARPPG